MALLAAASGSALGTSGVYKCIGSDGRISYQEQPCPESRDSQPMSLPSEFPPVNTAARDRLFEREAALDKRLEAERDRLTAESVARISRPDPVFIASEPQSAVFWPGVGMGGRWPQNQRPQARQLPRNGMRSGGYGTLR